MQGTPELIAKNHIAYEAKLYKKHSSGQIGDWRVTVESVDGGRKALMKRYACKVIGGKPVVTVTEINQGKNLGKANETSAVEQAVSEAESRFRKQIDKGYVLDLPSTGSEVTNSLGCIQPMLAHPIEKVKGWQFPVFCQYKLDGHRMLASFGDGSAFTYSRGSKSISIRHITEALSRVDMAKWRDVTLDGELYIHGETLQKISSYIKKERDGTERLVYHLYDVHTPDARTYDERLALLREIVDQIGDPAVVLLDTQVAENHADLDRLHAEALSKGYEGTIIRHGDAAYESSKRSKSLLKRKDMQDAEFLVVDVVKGKPNIKDHGIFEVPIFVCMTDNGDRFNCTAPGSMEEKHAFWLQKDALIGRQLTVQFFNLTEDGVPFLPVALRFRENI
jgi:DNA ligase-1